MHQPFLAEEKIQYIKYRPVHPFDSKSPVNFTIPGNSSQYISLRDLYSFVECHIEEFNAEGTPLMMSDQPQPSQKRTAKEAFSTPEKQEKDDTQWSEI